MFWSFKKSQYRSWFLSSNIVGCMCCRLLMTNFEVDIEATWQKYRYYWIVFWFQFCDFKETNLRNIFFQFFLFKLCISSLLVSPLCFCSLSSYMCSTKFDCKIDGKLTNYVCVGHAMIDWCSPREFFLM